MKRNEAVVTGGSWWLRQRDVPGVGGRTANRRTVAGGKHSLGARHLPWWAGGNSARGSACGHSTLPSDSLSILCGLVSPSSLQECNQSRQLSSLMNQIVRHGGHSGARRPPGSAYTVCSPACRASDVTVSTARIFPHAEPRCTGETHTFIAARRL